MRTRRSSLLVPVPFHVALVVSPTVASAALLFADKETPKKNLRYFKSPMFELYALLGLAGIGYMLGTSTPAVQNKQGTGKPVPQAPPLPSADTVYESKHFERADRHVRNRVSAAYAKSTHPRRHSVIGNNYRTVHSAMAGIDIPASEFRHNNMTPFYKGTLKQNVDPSVNSALLESFTGTTPLQAPKRETGSLFRPEESAVPAIAPGGPPVADFFQERLEAPVRRANVLPFQQQMVGPGLDQGFNGVPHRDDLADRQFAMPRSVDDLRKGSNPRLTFQGRVLPGSGVQERAWLPNVEKRMPDTFVANDELDLLPTSAAVERDPLLVYPDMKPTARERTSAMGHTGGAGAAAVTKPALPPQGALRPPKGVTEASVQAANVGTIVKALIAPYLDALRPTRKACTSDALLPPMQAQIPPKQTVYDPSMVARTTIKETLVQDVDVSNLKGAVCVAVYDPNAIAARTTIRQTLPDADWHANMRRAAFRGQSIDPDLAARVTMKETTTDSARDNGNVDATDYGLGAYQSTAADARATLRQGLSDRTYLASAKEQNEFVPMSHQDVENAEIHEKVLAGRAPADQGAKVFTGDAGAVETKDRALQVRFTGNRERGYSTDGPCGELRLKSDDFADSRFNPELLQGALRDNPYNRSIVARS